MKPEELSSIIVRTSFRGNRARICNNIINEHNHRHYHSFFCWWWCRVAVASSCLVNGRMGNTGCGTGSSSTNSNRRRVTIREWDRQTVLACHQAEVNTHSSLYKLAPSFPHSLTNSVSQLVQTDYCGITWLSINSVHNLLISYSTRTSPVYETIPLPNTHSPPLQVFSLCSGCCFAHHHLGPKWITSPTTLKCTPCAFCGIIHLLFSLFSYIFLLLLNSLLLTLCICHPYKIIVKLL